MKPLLWLRISLGLVCVSVTEATPLKVMSSPNLLRVGTAEKVFVECQDCGGQGPMQVTISVWNHPTNNTQLGQTNVMLNANNNYQALGELVIPPESFDKDPTVKQYVYLQAVFPGHTLEKVVLVSFQSGYMFIQTDKTLYTPDSTVQFRIFALTPDMKPISSREAAGTFVTIVVEIENPEGTVIRLDPVGLQSGMYTGIYRLPETASVGQWKVVSRFQSNPQQSYSAEFEVKNYVLPSYEVRLASYTPFYYYDESFDVKVKATYLFGKEVDGMAYVVFGVMKDGIRKAFPASLQRIPIIDGNGQARLQKEQILKTYPAIEEMVGGSLFVTATVYTDSGSEMVEGELRNILIVASPYFINFDKTPKYFKAGMAFDVMVTVTNLDGTPAEGVPIVVESGQFVHGSTGANGMAILVVSTRASDTSLSVTARTNVKSLPAIRQTSNSMVARPHQSRNHNFIDIDVVRAGVRLGTDLRVHLYLNSQSRRRDLTYLILSRGQLVEFGRQRSEGQVIVSLIIPVTKKLLPSFRLIAYYHPTPNEVVSDSVWVEVDDSCMGALVLQPKNPVHLYEPRKIFSLRVTGDPGATVGLVAVDKGAYVLNKKNLLTQKKVWETVDKADTGCTPGGGENSMGVFFDAGLMFHTDTASGTPLRQEVNCPSSSARKRRVTRSEDDYSYMDSSEIVSRTRFLESWLWVDINIPACSRNHHCEVNTIDRSFPLIDTTTTWVLTGISLSQNNGICVGKPLDVVASKPFFIDLKLPYSAVVGEQIEIRAILHNSLWEPITVRVELMENVDVCSSASKRGKYIQEVQVGPSTTRAVPFVIVPIKQGDTNIEIKAAVKDSWHDDGVRKILRVVPNGVLTKVIKFVELAPKGGTQELTINNMIPLTEMVRNTTSSARVFITGREQVGPLMENVIGALSMGSLIYQPSGSGEQNIYHMTHTVIAATYLDKTNQWEAVGLEKRSEAVNHIRTGVLNEIAYSKTDGSFSVFRHEKSSTWLTAFVVKVFSLASSLINIDNNIICNGVRFLILGRQQPNGMFQEAGRITQREYTGDVFGGDSDASMTAFCLIAIQESQQICHTLVNGLPEAMSKSVSYLERRLPSLTNPYAVAITSYALANANRLNKQILYNFVSPERTYWISPRGLVLSLETTAYALLALVKGGYLEEARPIVQWLIRQTKVRGGYGSLQATLMVYQAVSEYWTVAKEPDYNLYVELNIPGHSAPYFYSFNWDNYYTMRTSKRFEVNEDVTVKVSGTGKATLTLVTQYYAMPKEIVSDCTKFNLSVDFSLVNVDEMDGDIYKLKVEFSFKNNEEDALMSVLDIILPSGFAPMDADLQALSLAGHSIFHLENNKHLSDKASVIVYLKKVAHNRVEELTFRMRQIFKVAISQPASVSIYEYFDEAKCMRYYHPQRRDGRLLRFCKGDECLCAEAEDPMLYSLNGSSIKTENCSMLQQGHINNQERLAKACESSKTKYTDFVYQVILEDVHYDMSIDTYTMRIQGVIKYGTYDTNAPGQLRTFQASSLCRQSLNLRKSKGYVIMGTAEDTLPDESTQSFKYLLGENTWIEYWPRGDECQAEEYRPTCLGMQDLFAKLELQGCNYK